MQQYQAEINLTESYLKRWGMSKEEFWKKLKIAESNKKDPDSILRLFGVEVSKETIEFMNAFLNNQEIGNPYKAAGLALHSYYDCFHMHENLHKVMDLVATYLIAMGEGKIKTKGRPGFIKARKLRVRIVEGVK